MLSSPAMLTSRWELAAEAIAVKIRWFGILFGYLLVNLGQEVAHRDVLNSILGLGVLYALVDTGYSLRGRVFLGSWPLVISGMEALFVTLLCYYHAGLDSPFRYYYVLSLICCAVRHSRRVTNITWALHSAGFVGLYFALPPGHQSLQALVLTLVLLGWVTWACSALALLLKQVGDYLGRLNAALEENRASLEERMAERTRELREAQAHVLHQEKMAAFGLLAAGIAHEVGNPLTAISSMVQILQRREQSAYTQEKLGLVEGQLRRIQGTLRELINFSRPASPIRQRVALADVVREALGIAKYTKRFKGRCIEEALGDDLPPVLGVRDQLVQAILNLILNAIDATATGGRIRVAGRVLGPEAAAAAVPGEPRLETQQRPLFVELSIADDGCGIAAEDQPRLFQPYFTTKQHGTGLGLFVTRRLIEDHGGRVECTSGRDQGTTFRIRLPALPTRPSGGDEAQAVLAAAGSEVS